MTKFDNSESGINTNLLREQIKFLDEYPWREPKDLDYVGGVINLLETILDKEGKVYG